MDVRKLTHIDRPRDPFLDQLAAEREQRDRPTGAMQTGQVQYWGILIHACVFPVPCLIVELRRA